MKKLQGMCAFMFMGCLGSLMAYVPERHPLVLDVIASVKEQLIQSAEVEPAVAGPVATEPTEVAQVGQNFAPVAIEERDGFSCVNGFTAFDQIVVQATRAHPVIVFFFAQRDLASKKLWQELKIVAEKTDKGSRFVAVDIFQNIGSKDDNENYQIALRCMETVGLASFQLPVVVFFKDGLMCTAKQAVLTGEITRDQVEQVIAQIVMKRA